MTAKGVAGASNGFPFGDALLAASGTLTRPPEPPFVAALAFDLLRAQGGPAPRGGPGAARRVRTVVEAARRPV
jgi:hypothetical protein